MNKDNRNIWSIRYLNESEESRRKERESHDWSKPPPQPDWRSPLEDYLLDNKFKYYGKIGTTTRHYEKHLNADGEHVVASSHMGGLRFVVYVRVWSSTDTDNTTEDTASTITIIRYGPLETDGDYYGQGGRWSERLFDAEVDGSYNDPPVNVGPNHWLRDENGQVSVKELINRAEKTFDEAAEDMVRNEPKDTIANMDI